MSVREAVVARKLGHSGVLNLCDIVLFFVFVAALVTRYPGAAITTQPRWY